MTSTSRRRNRRQISKTDFFRFTPFTRTEQVLADATQTSLIDVPASDVIVASVPKSMSYTMAAALEEQLTAKFKRPVIVLSDNITLCGVTGPLVRSEIEEALKGLEGDSDGLVKEIFARTEGEGDTEEDGGDEEESGEEEETAVGTGKVDA